MTKINVVLYKTYVDNKCCVEIINVCLITKRMIYDYDVCSQVHCIIQIIHSSVTSS